MGKIALVMKPENYKNDLKDFLLMCQSQDYPVIFLAEYEESVLKHYSVEAPDDTGGYTKIQFNEEGNYISHEFIEDSQAILN